MSEWVTAIADLATAGAAVAVAVVAWRGLNTWREQLHGRTEYEHARRLARAVYRVRDEAYRVRHPGDLASEANEAEIEEIGQYRAELWALRRRLARFDEAMMDFEREIPDAEVLWGDSAREAAGNVREVRAKLHSLIEHFHVEASINHALGLDEPDTPLASPDDTDPLWDELHRAVRQIEALFEHE